MQNFKVNESADKKMKILYINRRDYLENIGGDSIQMLSIKKHLDNRTQSTVQTNPATIRKIIGDYDIVHIFNIQRLSETAYFVNLSKKWSKKVVLSPIYADFSELEKHGRAHLYKTIKTLLPKNLFNLAKDVNRILKGISYTVFLKENFHNFNNLFAKTLNACDCIVPNSFAEAEFLQSFQLTAPIKIIHNGIDEKLLKRGITAQDFLKKYKIPFKKFVLCVARIDERKNILNLLKATNNDQTIKIVLIGKVYPTHESYYKRCLAFIKPDKVLHIKQSLSQEELCGAYKACHTHALVSWLETPGLATLEAGFFGANLVVGKCPPVEEYFKEKAYYCDSADLNSIYKAIKQSLADKRDAYDTSNFIKENYPLTRIANEYLELYKTLQSQT